MVLLQRDKQSILNAKNGPNFKKFESAKGPESFKGLQQVIEINKFYLDPFVTGVTLECYRKIQLGHDL